MATPFDKALESSTRTMAVAASRSAATLAFANADRDIGRIEASDTSVASTSGS